MSLDALDLGPTILVPPGVAGDQPVVVCTRKQVIRGTTSILVYAGRCLLVGVILRAGAADTILRVHDSGDRNTRPDAQEVPGVRTTSYNGFVGQTIIIDFGIVATLDQADAVGWVLFAPF